MRFFLLVVVACCAANSQAQERRWKCTGKDDHELIRTDKSIPCPIGFKADEIDANGNVIPNGYDPLAGKQFMRCIGISKVTFYGTENCLKQKVLGLMKGVPVTVNREGFTPEEARVDAKRRENMARQTAWESGQVSLPPSSGLQRQGEIKNISSKEQECRAWKNSNILEPSPEKQKYLDKNC